MKFPGMKLIGVVALSILALSAQAAQFEIEWDDPRRFSDIMASNMDTQPRFEQRVMDELSRHFRDRALRYLPPDHTLSVHMKDLDLAGEVEWFHPGYPWGLRVVRNLFFPRLDFSYELRDDAGVLVAGGDETIWDVQARTLTMRQGRQDPLFYEKHVIDQWFQKRVREGWDS
jgi:hypothetical protein